MLKTTTTPLGPVTQLPAGHPLMPSFFQQGQHVATLIGILNLYCAKIDMFQDEVEVRGLTWSRQMEAFYKREHIALADETKELNRLFFASLPRQARTAAISGQRTILYPSSI